MCRKNILNKNIYQGCHVFKFLFSQYILMFAFNSYEFNVLWRTLPKMVNIITNIWKIICTWFYGQHLFALFFLNINFIISYFFKSLGMRHWLVALKIALANLYFRCQQQLQWTVPQLSIIIIYNSTWSILIQ